MPTRGRNSPKEIVSPKVMKMMTIRSDVSKTGKVLSLDKKRNSTCYPSVHASYHRQIKEDAYTVD